MAYENIEDKNVSRALLNKYYYLFTRTATLIFTSYSYKLWVKKVLSKHE